MNDLVIILAGVVPGVLLAHRAGLSVTFAAVKRPMLVSLAIGAAGAAYCAIVDAAFHSLPTNFVALVEPMSLSARLIYFPVRSVVEALIYQLILGSALAFIVSRFTCSPLAIFAAIFRRAPRQLRHQRLRCLVAHAGSARL